MLEQAQELGQEATCGCELRGADGDRLMYSDVWRKRACISPRVRRRVCSNRVYLCKYLDQTRPSDIAERTMQRAYQVAGQHVLVAETCVR